MAIAAEDRNQGRQWALVANQSFDYTQVENGVAINAVKIPGGCRILRGFLVIDTAFDGTTPTLDVGDGTTGDRFVDGADATATGDTAFTVDGALSTTPDFVTITLAVTGTPTQGAGTLIVEYIGENRSREVVPDYG